MIKAKSPDAIEAYELVSYLQLYFTKKLNALSEKFGESKDFEEVFWLRDEGKHGGGSRLEARDTKLFNRGSVNVSQVQYDDDASKKLASATAVSTIIHPTNPNVPSVHMHISWTQMRDTQGYWRIMADLNPSIEDEIATEKFSTMLRKESGKFAQEALQSGDKYFTIPVLGRTRGVSHFYLENFNTGDFNLDKAYAKNMGEKVIDTYIEIISDAIKANLTYTKEQKEKQLAYHTLYLFQVLTLDRGTTSGLLVHSQNDVGIMGSIPSHINRELLESWIDKMPKPQEKLLRGLIKVLPNENPTLIEEETKKRLAQVVREHYKVYPKALSMQASGKVIPETVKNHS